MLPRRRNAQGQASRRPHGDATVAAVRELIEETTLAYGEISARTGVGRASISRWARDLNGTRPFDELERAPQIDADKLMAALQLLKMARLESQGWRGRRRQGFRARRRRGTARCQTHHPSRMKTLGIRPVRTGRRQQETEQRAP